MKNINLEFKHTHEKAGPILSRILTPNWDAVFFIQDELKLNF